MFKCNKGVTLIETLITILIVAILTMGIYKLIDFSIKVTTENKHRVAATTIANQKMEKVRNLPYSDVGTVAGIVNGVIFDNETVTQGGDIFQVNTFVKYEDDDFDGLDGAGDTIPTDYKSVTITVSWSTNFDNDSVINSSLIAPRGLETSAGGGTLFISVFNASGIPVEDAQIHIENNILNPIIDFDADTNSDGELIFYGAPTSTEAYEITVTKTGYSSAYTSERNGVNLNPTKPHSTVVEQQKTEVSFAIDFLANLNITTINQDLLENWQVNTDTTEEDQTNPDLDISSTGNMYFVWEDSRNGNDSKIYAGKYNTSGTSLWASDVIISSANNQVNPDIKVDSSENSYITWNDNSNGNQDAYLVKIDSSGNDLWGGSKKINTDASNKDQTHPQLFISEVGFTATTTVVWQDNRSDDWDIYATRIAENGDYIWSPDIKINTDATATNQYSPAITVDSSDNIYIVWTDERNGDQDIYAQKYDSSGNSYWVDDVRVNINIGPSAQGGSKIALNPSSNSAYGAWYDGRNDDLDVYASEIDLYGETNLIANVPLVISGAKRVGENPIIYKYSENHTTNAIGYVGLSSIEWDAYSIELQAGYTDYSIVMSDPVRPINLMPSDTIDVTIYLD